MMLHRQPAETPRVHTVVLLGTQYMYDNILNLMTKAIINGQ